VFISIKQFSYMLNSGTFSQLGTHSAMALDGDGLRGKARNWRIEKMVKLVGEEGMEKKEGREKEGLVLLPRYWVCAASVPPCLRQMCAYYSWTGHSYVQTPMI